MGDEAGPLDREDEVVRRLLVPGVEAPRALQRVERSVDLNTVQPSGRVTQLVALRQAFRVEDAAPGRVAPSRDADPDVALSTTARRRQPAPPRYRCRARRRPCAAGTAPSRRTGPASPRRPRPACPTAPWPNLRRRPPRHRPQWTHRRYAHRDRPGR